MKKLALFCLVALVTSVGCQPASPPTEGTPDSNTTSAASTTGSAGDLANTTQYVMAVEGMQCGVACPPRVKESLESVPGVAQVTVDYDTKTATIQADPAAFDQQLAIKALADAGFSGSVN